MTKFAYISTKNKPLREFMFRVALSILTISVSSHFLARAQQVPIAKDSIDFLHKKIKEEAYSNTEAALSMAERSLALSIEHKLPKEEIQSYYSFGLVYYYKSFYRISNDYYRLVVQSAKSDQKQLSAAWNNMGINYETLGQLDSALYAYQESRKIDKALSDLRGEHMTLINIALLNGSLRRHDLAFSQTHKAREFFQKTNDLDNLGLCYMNLGLFHGDAGSADSCKMYYELAAKTYLETKDYPNLFQTYLNQTNFWVFKKERAKAEDAYKKAKLLLKELDGPFYEASIHGYASLLFDHFGRKDSAIYYSKKALAEFESIGFKDKVKYEYSNLANLYAETGNIPGYKYATQRYDSLSKLILNEDINNRLAEMEVRYKLEMKNLQIQNAEQLLAEKRVQVFVISAFSLALLLALLFTYRLYDRVKLANKSLYQKNIELVGSAKQKENPVIQEESVTEENTLLNKFHKLLEEEQYFKKPELSLKMAAQELGTNEKYLSQAINKGNDNFNTYINRFRVNEARKLILEGLDAHISIEELGMMVGFTNRHTFSRAFAQITGISPSEFRKIHLSSKIEK